jgi:hypothetical protein
MSEDDRMMKAMYGQFARHVPVMMFVQDQGPGVVSFIGASKSIDMRYGSNMTHQLIVGELIVRPHYVIGSNHFRGYGLAGMLQACDLEEWIENGQVLADPMGKMKALNLKVLE